jgi:hypothetical protein
MTSRTSIVLAAFFALQSLTAACGREGVTVCSSPACSGVSAPSNLLSANPSAVAFGDVSIGSSGSQNVALTNASAGTLTITRVDVTGAGFSASGLTAPVTLAPVESRTLSVTFTPVSSGSFTGQISVAMNAAASPVAIGTTGKGVLPPPPPPPPPPGVVVAFPGAQGGGALSVGGRGGAVYLVTSLLDAGPGSLRACVAASGPRTCVFRTGGTITLASSLTVANPFITIAGQTAPGGGIQLTGPLSPGDPTLLITTHDVVVQYLRVRRGHNAGEICNAMPWSCGTSLEVFSNTTATNPYNIMIDHVSAEWSNYDAMIALGSNAAANQPRSMTVSRSILGEALGGAGQVVGVNFGGYSGAGPTAPDAMTDLDFHHNLFAGTSHRMPLLTVKSARLVNNFVYGWTYYPMRSKGLRDFINNYFKTRAGQVAPSHEIHAWTENAGNDTSLAPSFYLSGNAGPSDPTGTSNWTMTALAVNESAGEASSPLSTGYQRSSPIPAPSGYVPMTPDLVSTLSSGSLLNAARAAPYDGVGASRKLDCSGKWVDALDPVDSRIVTAVTNGTNLYGSFTYDSVGTSPQSQIDLGGWPILAAGIPCADANANGLPDVWESYWAASFALGSILDPAAKNFADAYTNLEHYINGTDPTP